MRSSFLLPSVLLASCHQVLAQAFSGYAGACTTPGYSGDPWDTVVTGIGCGPNSGAFPPVRVLLNLDNCLSFVDGALVGGQGGGYVSEDDCNACVGNGPYDYSCICQGTRTPSIRLNDLVGVNMTNGKLCCNAGTDEAPAVRCSD